jgi:hypothetical protein
MRAILSFGNLVEIGTCAPRAGRRIVFYAAPPFSVANIARASFIFQ